MILAHHSSVEPCQGAVTEYRVLGPKINGCSWVELCPLTGSIRKKNSKVYNSEVRASPDAAVKLCLGDLLVMDSNPETASLHMQGEEPLDNELRVHCAEALGTPIVGDYKYGWFVHSRWKQMPRVDIEPTTGKPEGLDVQKGSVLSKVPLLHLHCRELVLPNIAKFLHVLNNSSEELRTSLREQPDVLRFVATMPSHMRISWNLMSSYLV
ncbi:RNA pseudouridine synthase 3, mitochondrial [Glycine soja]